MQLRKGQAPGVEINTKSASRRAIRNLLGRGAIPTYQKAPEDLRWLVEGEEPSHDQIDECGILDLLGQYDPATKKVVVYDLLIRLCARELGIDYQLLCSIVLCHELAHAATHLGLDEAGCIWAWFGAAPASGTEYFAQIYTHLLYAKKERRDMTDAMQKLAADQPAVYRTYIPDHYCPVQLSGKQWNLFVENNL